MKQPTNDAVRRGLVIIAYSIGLLIFLIVGGGFLNATHARYWYGVLWGSFAFGLICPGLPLCLWIRHEEALRTAPPRATVKIGPSIWHYLAFVFVLVTSMAVSNSYFRSDFANTNVGMHLFPVLMGAGCGALAMIGLGIAFSKNTKPIIDDRLL